MKYKTFIIKLAIVIVVIVAVLTIKDALAVSYGDVEVQEVITSEVKVVEEIQVINTNTFTPIEQIKYVFGDNWKVAYAVMMSEGNNNPKAINYNTDSRKTHDRGLY